MLLHQVEIECLPGDLVSEIEVDATQIADTDTVIYVKDLQAPSGVTILTDPETPVARFEYESLASEEEEEGTAPSADEVEVITKGKADEDNEI